MACDAVSAKSGHWGDYFHAYGDEFLAYSLLGVEENWRRLQKSSDCFGVVDDKDAAEALFKPQSRGMDGASTGVTLFPRLLTRKDRQQLPATVDAATHTDSSERRKKMSPRCPKRVSRALFVGMPVGDLELKEMTIQKTRFESDIYNLHPPPLSACQCHPFIEESWTRGIISTCAQIAEVFIFTHAATERNQIENPETEVRSWADSSAGR